jgi:hypothetical protein
MVFVADSASANAQPRTTTARPEAVDLGVAWEGYLQVIGNVKPGESVVVQGNERLRPGQPIVVVGEQNGPELKTAAKEVPMTNSQ